MEDVFGLGKLTDNGLEVLKMVYPDLAQPAFQKVGMALGTVFELSNTVLLPLKMANEKGSILFKRHMEKYEENLNRFSNTEITQVPPSLGLKIIDELFTVTNEDIAQLFINLLTHASTVSGVKYAHPGFVEVIKNLSEDEAKLINAVYKTNQEVKYAFLVKNEGFSNVRITERKNNAALLTNLTFEENTIFYMDNLIKLGLVEDSNSMRKNELEDYKALENLFELKKKGLDEYVKESQDKGELQGVQIQYSKGRYELTSYGAKFIECIS